MAALLLAKEWISDNGISPVPYVNRQIAKEIAKRTGLRVYSTVIDPEIPKQVAEDARMSNVELIKPQIDDYIATLHLTPTRNWLFLYKHFYPKIKRLGLPIRLVVGHSASGEDNTASAACSILKKECNEDAHLWIFVHFIPDRLIQQPRESVDSPGFREEKAKEIDDCAVMSNLVAAVGQIVYNHCKNQFRGLDDRDRPECKCYLPYPEEQFSKLVVSPADIKTHAEILMICNKHGEDPGQLAKFESIVESICEMSCNRPDVRPIFKVHMANISDDDLRSWLNGQIAKQPGPGPAKITVVTSSNTKASAISTALRQCTVLVDQDLESTFSVIGLNCLAAGTPCLLSNHCGLARFVSEDANLTLHSDNITVNIGAGQNHGNMVREWTSSLNKVFEKYDREFRRSQELKPLINSSASEGTIAKLMESLMKNCPRNEVDDASTRQSMDQSGTSSQSGLPAHRGRDDDTHTRGSSNSSTSVSSSQSQTEPVTSDSQNSQDASETLDIKVTVRDSMDTEPQSQLDECILDHINNDNQLPEVKEYCEKNDIAIGLISRGESIIVSANVKTVEGLETIWSDMWSGKLDEVFRKDLITAHVLKKLNTTTVIVKASIRTWEYRQCKALLQYRRTEEQFVSSSQVTEPERIPLRMRRATKVIQDPIHGTIEMDPVYMTIIDTPEFQRLRNIKKLGTVNFVYPGSVHTRFEHSIGRCFLALKLVRHLKDNYQNTLGITKEEGLCVGLAALCLDLGHGPFSSLFEDRIIPALQPTGYEEFTYTLASVKIFDLMVKKYKLQEVFKTYGYQMMDNEFHLVKEMIYGPLEFGNTYVKADSYQATSPYRYFLYEIVSNRRNGIDASEWDGLARDSYHLGIVHGNSMHERFIKFAGVLQVQSKTEQRKQICFRDKEASSACEMLLARFRQRSLTTFHPVKIAIDIMITDAFVAAAPHLQLRRENGEAVGMTEILNDMDVYMTLDDSMYYEILKSYADESLLEARSILERIGKRDIYKLVFKVEFPTDVSEKDIRKEDIIASKANDGSLEEDDLRITIISMDYGIGDKNPIDNMLFYSKENPVPRHALPEEMSHQMPKTFQERRLFVYVTDYRKKDVASRAVDEWARKIGLIKQTQSMISGTFLRSKVSDGDPIPSQSGIKRQVEETSGDETVIKLGKFD
ncbi:uncharacterized protein [Ptychodera flava]|uniref:uncharacterized protein isoform X2 n=1 Tax=Ptychodera flava TaxID=63121 RepID=UPI003969D015